MRLVDCIQTEEAAGAQVCRGERSVYLEGRELAFAAEAQAGDDLERNAGANL